jgi:hypothetical protein
MISCIAALKTFRRTRWRSVAYVVVWICHFLSSRVLLSTSRDHPQPYIQPWKIHPWIPYKSLHSEKIKISCIAALKTFRRTRWRSVAYVVVWICHFLSSRCMPWKIHPWIPYKSLHSEKIKEGKNEGSNWRKTNAILWYPWMYLPRLYVGLRVIPWSWQ